MSTHINCWKYKNLNKSGNHDNAELIKFKKPSETSMNCAVLNKANTYYINGSLQSFSSMVELWTNYYLHADTLSPFVSSFVTTMLMVRSRKVALDQSHLLRCLQNTIIKSGKHCFDLFKQQDASEITSFVFEEWCRESPHAQQMPSTNLKHQFTHNKCIQIILNEELMSMLPLQVTSNVQTSLNIFLQIEELTKLDSFFVIFVRATNQHLLIMKSQKLAPISSWN